MDWRSLLSFDSMITPKVITVVYWLLLVAVVVAGLGAMFTGGLTFRSFVYGVFVTALGALGVRIWCELLIVLFKLNENVQKISNSK